MRLGRSLFRLGSEARYFFGRGVREGPRPEEWRVAEKYPQQVNGYGKLSVNVRLGRATPSAGGWEGAR